ncbi:MAG: phosphoenolpyruvate--protein phosphotransferase [bacterium]|nr:phosphoenolpyruvate--protein phosphotransferase [bacterium]
MTARRRIIKGASISSGIAMGRARVVAPGQQKVPEMRVAASAVKSEIAALDRAVKDTVEELQELRSSAGKKLGDAVGKVFDAQLLIADDQEFLSRVREEITLRKRNAGFVYNLLVHQTTAELRRSPELYMRQMAEEIEGVAHRIMSHLGGGRKKTAVRYREGTIIVARTITPGEVLNYRNLKAVGMVAEEGGPNSHMALIARSLMIPLTVSGNVCDRIPNGSRLIVDGTNGVVILNPTDEEWADYQKKRKRQGPAILSRIKKLTEIPPTTADGVSLQVAANLEFPGPVDDILADHLIPVGLYRTEFLYLEGSDFPDENAQFGYYRRLAEKFSRTSVILRTFDLGSDKVRADSPQAAEANPALGWRGIRPMLEQPETFKRQVRAILRASTLGNLRILLPMISDVSEYKKARRLVSQVMFELRKEKIDFDSDIPVGIMVEVPSAALTADLLASEVDFVSIGTNDLTQYTMSADRNNSRVSGLYNPYHPSVINLIKMTVDACHRHQKPVNICGELAGDLLALPLFIGMGVSSLSMNPVKIFDCCRLVKKIDSRLVKHLVEPVLSSNSAMAVVRKLQNYRNALENK